MSMSLRDQLLTAGLATEKQSKDAERHLRQQQRQRQQLPKSKRGGASESELAAEQARLAKAARDQELSRRQREEANKKACQAQIEQLVEHNRLPRAQTDELYNFVDGNKIRRIPADAPVRERIGRGEIAIVRCNGRYELVPADTAARIRERDQHAVIVGGFASDPAGTDDETYRSFVVPDDLVW
ncbi:MAG: DUF2058 domain-containing protein [Steroidobacteraceae bacterium]